MKNEKVQISKEIAEEIMADDVAFIEIARSNVFCSNCSLKSVKNTSMKVDKYFLNDLGDIIMHGSCETCGSGVGRYMESGENPKSLKIAKKYIKLK
jgi:hypothetical protein